MLLEALLYTHHLQVLKKWKIAIIITRIQGFIVSLCNLFRIISFLVVIQKACQGVSHVFGSCVFQKQARMPLYFTQHREATQEKKKKKQATVYLDLCLG